MDGQRNCWMVGFMKEWIDGGREGWTGRADGWMGR